MAIFAKPETQAKRAVKFMLKNSSYSYSKLENELLVKSFTSLTMFIKSNRLSGDGLRGVTESILKKYLEFRSKTITKEELQQECVAIETYMSIQNRASRK